MSRVADHEASTATAPDGGGEPPLDLTDTDATIDPGAMLVGSFPRRRGPWAIIALYLVSVFVLITLNFALPRLMPGDPIDALMAFGNPNYVENSETRAHLQEYYDLKGSLPEQYFHYLNQLVHFDLGKSIYNNTPVRKDLGGKVAWTLLLIGTGAALSVLIAVPLGIHSGWKRGKRVDRGLLAFFVSYQNLPTFLTASVLFVILAAKLAVFPLTGATTQFSDYTGVAKILDIAYHLALPALVLAFDFATLEYLVMRSSMVGELGSDYLLGGRAKGLRERRLKYGYAGRNALLPVVTALGLNIGLGITSILFVEQIFGYPGVGQYMLTAIGNRDYPSMQGAFLVLALMVVTVNLFVDLLYRRLDPRTVT